MAAYHVVWECVVEQWLGVRRTTKKKHSDNMSECFKNVLCEVACAFVG